MKKKSATLDDQAAVPLGDLSSDDARILVERSLSRIEEMVLGLYDAKTDPLELALILLFLEERVLTGIPALPKVAFDKRMQRRLELAKNIVFPRAVEEALGRFGPQDKDETIFDLLFQLALRIPNSAEQLERTLDPIAARDFRARIERSERWPATTPEDQNFIENLEYLIEVLERNGFTKLLSVIEDRRAAEKSETGGTK